MNKIYLYILYLSFLPKQVFARVRTVGDMFENTSDNLGSTGILFQVVCYLLGLSLGIAGLLKLKEYGDNPGKLTLKEPLGRLVAAAFLISLPTVIAVIINSTVGDAGDLDLLVDL